MKIHVMLWVFLNHFIWKKNANSLNDLNTSVVISICKIILISNLEMHTINYEVYNSFILDFISYCQCRGTERY